MNSTQLPLLAASVPTPVQLRAELEDLVERELLGPRRGPEEEIVDGGVQDAYLVGMLAPRNRRLKAGEMDSLAADGAGTVEDGNSDDVSIPADSLAPSSIGLSCTVAGDTQTLLITARWGIRATGLLLGSGHCTLRRAVLYRQCVSRVARQLVYRRIERAAAGAPGIQRQ